MAKTPEGRVKDEVKKVLDELDAWWFMPVSNGMGRVGIPDFIACIEGKFVGIECKAPGKINNLSPNQQRELAGIDKASGFWVVVTSGEALRSWWHDKCVGEIHNGNKPRTQNQRDHT